MAQLKDQFKVDVADTGIDAVVDSDLIVLAVKPQNVEKVFVVQP
jgi:pyrroline-5-carboxylate reductase